MTAYPPPPVAGPPRQTGSAAGVLVGLLLAVGLVLLSLLVGFFSLFSGMMSDGCYEGVDTGICGDTGSAVYGITLIGFWLVLLVMGVLAFVMPLIWFFRGRNGWWWPLAALAVDAVALVLFIVIMGALSP